LARGREGRRVMGGVAGKLSWSKGRGSSWRGRERVGAAERPARDEMVLPLMYGAAKRVGEGRKERPARFG